MVQETLNIGITGSGGWGKNLVRNYYQMPNVHLKYICDLDSDKLTQAKELYPNVLITEHFDELLADPSLDAVVIATGASSHYVLGKAALEASKDIYIEKPLVLQCEHAEELIDLAESQQRVLMVGHLLEYHPVVNELKAMIDQGDLGDIYYIYCQRLNLGTVRGDENALWNFAPHDISVITYLLGDQPTDVSARGQSYLQECIEDVVFVTMNFSNSAMAHIHVSWLDPNKMRTITVVGSQKMAVFDDQAPNEKLRVYNKGAQVSTDYDSFAEYVSLRFGDITIPHIQGTEPLRLECEHFLHCVRTRQQPRSDGADGLRVVRVLDAAQRSLKQNGMPVSI